MSSLDRTGFVFWITGLSGSGKTTIGTSLQGRLNEEGYCTLFFDGDMVREMLKGEYGYSAEERLRISRVYGSFCKNIASQGVNVVMSCIALFHEVHEWNRNNIENYIEVLIDVSKEELSRRDSKNIYSNYLNGKIENVAGMDIVPEFPKNPDLILKNDFINVGSCVEAILVTYYGQCGGLEIQKI